MSRRSSLEGQRMRVLPSPGFQWSPGSPGGTKLWLGLDQEFLSQLVGGVPSSSEKELCPHGWGKGVSAPHSATQCCWIWGMQRGPSFLDLISLSWALGRHWTELTWHLTQVLQPETLPSFWLLFCCRFCLMRFVWGPHQWCSKHTPGSVLRDPS